MPAVPNFAAPAWLLLAAGLLLAGCAARAPLPAVNPGLALPQQLLVQRRAAEADHDWLLVIQDDAGGLRFTLLDPLGVPLARQRLQDGKWHSEGLLPPNPEARELFAALLFALTPEDRLQRFYPDARVAGLSRSLAPRWVVRPGEQNAFRLKLAPDTEYRITPLPGDLAQ